MPLTWRVWDSTSDDTTIDQNGLLTVGLDETAETLTVLADSHDGRRASVTVAVVDHIHRTALVPAKDKTCTQDGNIAHFRCSECGGLFEDASAVNVLTEDEVVIPAGHEYGELVAKKEPTCSDAGMQAHYKCSVCNQYFDEHKAETTAEALTIAIDPDAHAFGEWIAEVPADCTHTGTKAHKDCTLCGKHFDEGGAEIADLTIATNDKHDWGVVRYVWPSDSECKAERVCKHDGSHKETETVTATESVVTEATCEQKGKRFDSWNIKGVDDLTGLDLTKSPLTITMPANDINVAAVLEDIDYTVTVTGGTADKTTAHYGDSVTITANAPETGKQCHGYREVCV